jgi:hypothetical protein
LELFGAPICGAVFPFGFCESLFLRGFVESICCASKSPQANWVYRPQMQILRRYEGSKMWYRKETRWRTRQHARKTFNRDEVWHRKFSILAVVGSPNFCYLREEVLIFGLVPVF